MECQCETRADRRWQCSLQHLHADNLREPIEVLVTCMQGKVVLQYNSREPHVIRRNRCSLLPELAEDRCVMVGRLIVGEEYSHTFLQEKPPKRSFVLNLPTPKGKAGSKLAEHHERQGDELCFL